jgi:hypothetical protein
MIKLQSGTLEFVPLQQPLVDIFIEIKAYFLCKNNHICNYIKINMHFFMSQVGTCQPAEVVL